MRATDRGIQSVERVKRRPLGLNRRCVGLWVVVVALGAGWSGPEQPPRATKFYSTAAPFLANQGPVAEPQDEATRTSKRNADAQPRSQNAQNRETRPASEPPPRIASAPAAASTDRSDAGRVHGRDRSGSNPPVANPFSRALSTLAECRARFTDVHDYTCTFIKRERIDGRLSAPYSMHMKFRSDPASVYVKMIKPNAGREAIFIAGEHGGKVVVHDVGIGKFVAGTLLLDPKGSRAMEGCRHPITEAGIAHLLETLETHWKTELNQLKPRVTISDRTHVGDRPCTMIDTYYHARQPGLQFSRVKLYIDHEIGLPIRFEAYDWPKPTRAEGDLVEEYDYVNLKINVGLRELDFDPRNKTYSYGRF